MSTLVKIDQFQQVINLCYNSFMSKLDTSSYKGVRDFYPEEKFIQNYIFKVWREIVESFGYEEYDASILEPSEIYKEKSGEEIVNEQTFTFIDRGGRDVTLRPEMTPTIARMVAAKRRELGFPLRWYSIPNLFRYEAPQRGRLREHWQLNVDVFGIQSKRVDVELIIMADLIMKRFGAKSEDYEIRLNTLGEESTLTEVVKSLEKANISNIKIDKSLARGQAYYNGVVFEFFDTNQENPRSILGGGRYDNLTSLFGDQELPSAGFGAGDVTIRDFLETHNLLPAYKPQTHVYIAVPNPDLVREVVDVAVKLRKTGLNVSVDWSGKKLGDQIKTADKHKVPFVIVVGEDEIKSGLFRLKKLEDGSEVGGSIDEIARKIKS